MPAQRNYTTRYNYGTAAPKLRPQPRQGFEVVESPRVKPRKASGVGRIIFLFLISAALIASCIFLLSVRSEISSTNSQITTLQSELQSLRADNDAMEVHLNESIDLTEIYNIATTELGMVYPSDENVILYHRSDGGYVRAYEQIPTE